MAANLTEELNRAGASRFAPSSDVTEVERKVDETYNQWMAEQWFDHISDRNGGSQATFEVAKDGPTMGYVTRDSCPGKGDDIAHVPGMFPAFIPITADDCSTSSRSTTVSFPVIQSREQS